MTYCFGVFIVDYFMALHDCLRIRIPVILIWVLAPYPNSYFFTFLVMILKCVQIASI